MAISPAPPTTPTGTERAMFDFVDAYDRAFGVAADRAGLTVAQACVLGRLDERRTMGDLAAELECDASNVTQIVARLEARGLVRREQDPADRRARRIVRTAAGAECYAGFEESFTFARQAAGRLTREEQDELTRLLRKATG